MKGRLNLKESHNYNNLGKALERKISPLFKPLMCIIIRIKIVSEIQLKDTNYSRLKPFLFNKTLFQNFKIAIVSFN